MKQINRELTARSLPVTQDIGIIYVLSLVIAGLMLVASVAGLVYPATLYPTDELSQSFVPNDAVNLLLGLPILIGAMWAARRGKFLGLLFWPGALFYTFYNYVAYVFGSPLNAAFPLSLALVVLSMYTTIALVASIDINVVQQKLVGVVPEKIAGGALILYGTLFLLLVLGTIAQALTGQSLVPDAELAVMVADAMVAPAWLVGGVLLWRREVFGYLAGVSLLFQASALFIGVILVLLVQPLFTPVHLAVGDVVALCFMSLVCLIPFGIFLRRMARKQ